MFASTQSYIVPGDRDFALMACLISQPTPQPTRVDLFAITLGVQINRSEEEGSSVEFSQQW